MSGIYVGGKYIPKSDMVTTFASDFNKYFYYLSSNKKIRAITRTSDMYHCAPESLAFWSNEDE